MHAMGDTGLAGDYKLSSEADIQSESHIKVIDLFSMLISFLHHFIEIIILCL
jgi:hypothetical protein